MKKYILFSMICISFSLTANASLIHVKDMIYKTGEGESVKYWYLDMSAFINKTYSQQNTVAQQIAASNAYGFTDWHIASADELHFNLVVYGMPAFPTNNAEVIGILGINSEDGYELRLSDYSSGNHAVAQFFINGLNRWQIEPTVYGSTDRTAGSNIGMILVATVPEPATIVLFGLGIVFYNRHYNFSNKQ